MNEHGVVDYKQPIGGQNDYRTSSYRGHIDLGEQISTKTMTMIPKGIWRHFPERPVGGEDTFKTEHQAQFSYKAADPNLVNNPTLSNVKFMKRFEETRLRYPPKPMQPISSVFRRDFVSKPKSHEEMPQRIYMPTAVEPTSHLLINRAKPGYGKLLDLSATTSNLSYKEYSPQELSISIKDNITFWNWKKQKNNVFKTKEIMCDMFRSKDCPKRRREYQNPIKHVPHSGLTTEFKSNYAKHVDGFNFDVTHIKNRLGSCPEAPTQMETENRIYGSGKRIQRYIK